MSNSVSVYSESVEKKFQQWMEKYEIPDTYEFQLKTLFSLEEEYIKLTKESPDYIKSRENLLRMIHRMQLPSNVLKERKKESKDKTKVLIFCNPAQCHFFTRFIVKLSGSNDVSRVNYPLKDDVVVVTRDFEIRIKKYTDESSFASLRGQRFDECFNFTGSKLVDEVAQNLARKK